MADAEHAADADARDYETQRRKNIENNQKFLSDLGLSSPRAERPSHSPRKLSRRSSSGSELSPRKTSRRLQGIEPETLEIGADEEEDEEQVAMQKAAARERRLRDLDDFRVVWTGYRQVPYTEIAAVMPREIYLPLTLFSIGTTIYSLGQIYQGPKVLHYWSNRQALFLHPYPIGFRASKTHFGHLHYMAIDEGPDGPIFTVHREKGPVWTGPYRTPLFLLCGSFC